MFIPGGVRPFPNLPGAAWPLIRPEPPQVHSANHPHIPSSALPTGLEFYFNWLPHIRTGRYDLCMTCPPDIRAPGHTYDVITMWQLPEQVSLMLESQGRAFRKIWIHQGGCLAWLWLWWQWQWWWWCYSTSVSIPWGLRGKARTEMWWGQLGSSWRALPPLSWGLWFLLNWMASVKGRKREWKKKREREERGSVTWNPNTHLLLGRVQTHFTTVGTHAVLCSLVTYMFVLVKQISFSTSIQNTVELIAMHEDSHPGDRQTGGHVHSQLRCFSQICSS